MNITKLIVEILQSGKTVEIDGIGTFSTQMVDAHHDKEKGVFYPERRSAVFSNNLSGDNSVIDVLAEKECVNKEIAEKMWQTYISALKDKLTRQGSHAFSGLGTLVRCADGYAFTADPALDLDGGQSRPIENVNMYQSSDKDDPFATYEQSMQFVSEPEPESAPEPQNEPEPTYESEPEPQVETPIVEKPQEEAHTEAPIESEKPTLQKPVVERPAVFEKPVVERTEQAETVAAAEQPEPVAGPAIETSSEPTAAEPATESNAAPTDDNTASNDVQATIDTLDQIPDSGAPIEPTSNKKEEEKKKKPIWLWILIAVLLLLIGAGCYLFFNHSAWEGLKNGIASVRGGGSEIAVPDKDDLDAENADGTLGFTDDSQPAVSDKSEDADVSDEDAIHPEQEEEQLLAEENDSEAEEAVEPEVESSDNENIASSEPAVAPAGQNGKFFVQDYALPFTFSANLITYDQNDIDRGCRIVRNNLSEYVNRFLASRRYTNAKTPMMERISKYAKERFGELYDPNVFYVDRLLPQKDYIHDYLYDFLKQRRESQTCVTIQTELMKYSFLDEILTKMVDELGLQPDAPVAKEPVIVNVVPKAEVFTAQFVKESKQGYDIVAGFYTNKSTANRMANILKRQGCDAYIIDKQGLYYVSMGSAPTQTAAEALFKHIKSWYDGDIAIRKL